MATYFEELAQEAKDIRKVITEICWYMRGSISYTEAWGLSYEDKKIIQEFLKDNVERYKDSMTPVV